MTLPNEYRVGQKVEVRMGSAWSKAEVIGTTTLSGRVIVQATSPAWAEWEGDACECECVKPECLANPDACLCACPHGRWSSPIALRYADADDIRPESP